MNIHSQPPKPETGALSVTAAHCNSTSRPTASHSMKAFLHFVLESRKKTLECKSQQKSSYTSSSEGGQPAAGCQALHDSSGSSSMLYMVLSLTLNVLVSVKE